MVSITDEALDLPELLARLALDGAVPEHRLELLTDILTAAAATAGGIRPSVDALHTRLGEQDLLFGAWLGLLTGLRVTSLAIEATEAEVLEDVLLAFELPTTEAATSLTPAAWRAASAGGGGEAVVGLPRARRARRGGRRGAGRTAPARRRGRGRSR